MKVHARRHTHTAITILAALLFSAVVAPVAAHEPSADRLLNPSHFNGEGAGGPHGPDPTGESNEAQIAGDRFDGLNDAYIFRSVASADAQFYEWYVCDSANADPYPVGGKECGEPVARDDAPTLSSPPAGGSQVAAFRGSYDITIDGNRTVKGVACIEGPLPRPSHCTLATVDPVHLDDAVTTEHAATDSGEILQPLHGAAVLNGGVNIVAYSSESDIGRMFFCLDVGVNAVTAEDVSPKTGCDPGSTFDPMPDDSPACTNVPAGADCWEVTVDPPDNEEFSLGMVEQDDPTALVESGSGDCEGDSLVVPDGSDVGDDCQLDKIYLTSLPKTDCPGFANDPRNPIVGSERRDKLVGTKGPDVICGLGGKDVVRGLGGKDALLGGTGGDRLFGGPGADELKGGPKSDQINGGPGKDRCKGGSGKDSLIRCER